VGVTVEEQQAVAVLLGREPRGLEAVPVVDASGGPSVIRVASLVDDKPFPTLFWLVDAELCYRIDQLEATGLIAQLQAQIDADPELQGAMRQDHEKYMVLRDSLVTAADRARITELGYSEVFSSKGIGGIADFTRIRCLHTWYAAHLVEPNTVGVLLDRHLQLIKD
jgi:uncharacterized protein